MNPNAVSVCEVPCPCCGTSGPPVFLASIPYREIWRLLESEWNARFSPEVKHRHTPRDTTSLFECGRCGLHFFSPQRGGDEDFYRELGESQRYYIPWKWEFGWVRKRIPPSASVLDVGCGRGDFLMGLSGRVVCAVGVERNIDAAEAARSKGLEVHSCDLAAMKGHFPAGFDAVCAFHVLEHLPAARPFLLRLRACLRPGGELFVSVPNRARSAKGSLEPLDCPPHHLSRWAPDQLRVLGGLAGLRLRELAFEPVEPGIPRERLREAVIRAMAKVPAAGRLLGAWGSRLAWRLVLPDPLCSLYQGLGLFERWGYYGGSMVARCERPGD